MASLIINALGAKSKPSVGSMSKFLIPIISQEQDLDRLVELQEFMGIPTASPLVEAVLQADPEAMQAWRNKLAETYIEEYIKPLVSSLDSPDVNEMTIGDHDSGFKIFISGGMTEGSSPSATFDLWLDIFDRDENPYCDETFNAGFIALQEPFLPSMSSSSAYVSGVSITTKEKVLPPF